jgi:hypothetical protein
VYGEIQRNAYVGEGQRLKEKGYWEDEGVDGRIRLKFIFKRQCGWVFTGILWLRTGTNCGFS